MLLHKMLEQFENVGGAEKLGPVTSMMLISLWRKAEKMGNLQTFSISYRDLMVTSGIQKINEFNQTLNRLITFGYIRYKYEKIEYLMVHLNFNLYQPYKKPEVENKEHYNNVMDALEQQYLQLRGSGMFISPIDYEEMRKIADTNITVEQSVEWINECFEQHTPRYKSDSIRSFKYCAVYIMNKYEIELAKKGETNYGENRKHNESSNKAIISQKPKASSVARRRQEKLREEGYFRNMEDVNSNY